MCLWAWQKDSVSWSTKTQLHIWPKEIPEHNLTKCQDVFWGCGENANTTDRRTQYHQPFYFPLSDRTGMCVVHSVTMSNPALSVSVPKFSFIIGRVLSRDPSFRPRSPGLLCVWHLAVCGCLWSLQGAVLSGPRCTQLESAAKDLPFCPVTLSTTLDKNASVLEGNRTILSRNVTFLCAAIMLPEEVSQ